MSQLADNSMDLQYDGGCWEVEIVVGVYQINFRFKSISSIKYLLTFAIQFFTTKIPDKLELIRVLDLKFPNFALIQI